MNIRNLIFIAGLALLALGSLPNMGYGADDTLDPALKKALEDFTSLPEKDPEAAWRVLPTRFKKQIEAWPDYVKAMDAEVWDKRIELSRKGLKLLKTKKEIVLEYLLPEFNRGDRQFWGSPYDRDIEALSSILDGKLGKLETARKLDAKTFWIELYSKALKLDFLPLYFDYQLRPRGGPFLGISFERRLFSIHGAKLPGALVLAVEDAMKEGALSVKFKSIKGDQFEILFVKIDDQWYPQDLANNLGGFLNDPDRDKPRAMAAIKRIDEALDKLSDATTVEEFRKILPQAVEGTIFTRIGIGR